MKVLIVDDERILADTLVEYLKQNKIPADAVYDGDDAVAYAMTGNYDLIVLDIMLPKMNGLDVLKTLRRKNLPAPVLLLSARSELSDKVDGLNLGADDYLTKPFAMNELLARIKALSRRKGEYVGDIVKFSDIELNKDTYELCSSGNKLKLSGKEYQIMEMLILNPKIIIPKEKFIEKIWGYDSEAEYNSVEVYISFLRKKLSALGAEATIKAVRGAGYILEEKSDD